MRSASLRTELWRALKQCRAQLRRAKVVDLGTFRHASLDTLMRYGGGASTIALLRMPTDRGVTMPLFRLSGERAHPFISILRSLTNNGSPDFSRDLVYVFGEMEKFYGQFQPPDALALLGVSGKTGASSLQGVPAHAAVMPWDIATPDREARAKAKSVREENAAAGVDIGIEGGWAWSGPVSDRKRYVEASRLLNVFRSIQNGGYKRSDSDDGDIRATILVHKDGRTVWQARVGQHRAICLAALEWETIPVRITRIVAQQAVRTWPNVVNGLFSEELALQIFSNHFE